MSRRAFELNHSHVNSERVNGGGTPTEGRNHGAHRTRVGILNGENPIEAISRDARRVGKPSPLASQKALMLGLAFYGMAIASLLLFDGKHIAAYFLAALGIILTALGDFLKRRPPQATQQEDLQQRY
ncbi:MAG: hypothetical protein ACE5QF_05865 [Thermoplasmata archaeon]